MNKQEFINKYALKTNKTKKESAILVETFLEVLKESLKIEDKISFIGDFSLEIVPTKEKKARNPKTGEEIIVPAGKKLKFKAGKLIKEIING